MDLNKLFSGEGVQILNPNYTGKRDKKNPKYINLPVTEENQSSIYSDALSSVPDYGNTFKDVDADKYEKYGITISRPTLANIEDELAEAQSMWDKAFNSLAQTAGEIVLGGLSAMGTLAEAAWKAPIALLDIGTSEAIKLFTDEINTDPNRLRRSLGIDDNDYSNWWSEAFDNFKEKWNNEVVPIYAERDAGINNPSWSWFFKGLPTVASTLTLLLPTQAAMTGVKYAAKGAKYLGKVAKITKNIEKAESLKNIAAAEKVAGITDDTIKLSPLQKWLFDPTRIAKSKRIAEVGSEGLLMRTLENYQEAHQTHQITYDEAVTTFSDETVDNYGNKKGDVKFKEFVDNNKELLERNNVDTTSKHEVAKFIAGQAADRTFVFDYLNTGFDIWQLMTLPKLGKLAKKASGQAVSKAEREQARYMANIASNKTKDAAEKAMNTNITESLSKFQKAKDWTKDFLKGSGMTALSQMSEGVEEIVNYISQQEGTSYGRVLYDKENVLTIGDRFSRYIQDPQMWESGFWGVFGGITFGAVHGAINKYNIRRQTDKLFEQTTKGMSDEQKEKLKSSIDWNLLVEEPEVQEAVKAIDNRAKRFQTLVDKIKKINGPNPVNPLDNDKPITGNVEAQQALIRAQLIQQYRTECAMEALNSGTYDSLVSHLSSNEVKQAFINLGVIDESTADSFIAETLNDFKTVKDRYYSELSRVNSAITKINSIRPITEQIPVQYVKLIAENNTRLALDNLVLDRQIAGLDDIISKVSNGEHIGSTRDIAIGMIAHQYGMLDAQRRLLESSEEIKDNTGEPITDWRRKRAIENIKFQQQALLNNMDSVFVDGSGNPIENASSRKLGAMLHVIRRGKAYRYTGSYNLDTLGYANDNYVEDLTDEDYKATDEELIKKYNIKAGFEGVSNETVSQMAKVQDEALKNLTSENGLANTNSQLFNLCLDRCSLELSKAINNSQLVTSVSAVANKVDELFNEYSNVRAEQIEKAASTITDLYNKYKGKGQEHIHTAIVEAYFNNRNKAYELAKQYLTETGDDGISDADSFIAAIKLIDYTAGANRLAFAYIQDRLDEFKEKAEPDTNPAKTPDNAAPGGEAAVSPSSTGGSAGPIMKPARTSTSPAHTDRVVNGTIRRNINNSTFTITISGNKYKLNLRKKGTTNSYEVRFMPDATEEDKYIIATRSGLFSDVSGSSTLENTKTQITKVPIIQEDSGKFYVETDGEVQITQEVVESQGDIEEEDDIETFEEGEDEVTFDEDDTTEEDEFKININNDITEFFRTFIANKAKLIDEIKNDPNYWTKKADEIFNKFNTADKPISDDALREYINNSLNSTKRAVDLVIKRTKPKSEDKKINALDDSAETVAMASAFIDDSGESYGSLFESGIQQLLENYVALEPLRSYVSSDGNVVYKIITLRDIIKLCLNIKGVNDKVLAARLQSLFIQYINSVNKQSRATGVYYKIADEEDAINGDIVEYIDKTALEYKEIKGKNTDGIANEQRVQMVNPTNTAEAERVANWYSRVSVGDRVIIRDHNPLEQVEEDASSDITEVETGIDKIPGKDSTALYLFAKDDDGEFLIGKLPKAHYDGGGVYHKNMGFQYSLSLEKNNVKSPLLNVFNELFTFYYDYVDDNGNIDEKKLKSETSPDDAEIIRSVINLRKQLAKASVSKLSEADYDDLGRAIVACKIFNRKTCTDFYTGAELVQNKELRSTLIYYTKKPVSTGPENTHTKFMMVPDYAYIAKHLLSIYGYTIYSTDGRTKDEIRDEISASLLNWFTKLYDSYDSLNQPFDAKDGEETTVEITAASPGEIILISDNNKTSSYDKCVPVQEGVANLSKARLCAIDTNSVVISRPNKAKKDQMAFSDNESTLFGTYIALFSNNIYPSYVRAYGLRLTPGFRENRFLNNTIAFASFKLGNIIKNLDTNLAASRNNPANRNTSYEDEFEDFLTSLIALGDNNKIPLFVPTGGSNYTLRTVKNSSGGKKGISINYIVNNKRNPDKTEYHHFVIYYENNAGKTNLSYEYSIKSNADGKTIVSKHIHSDKEVEEADGHTGLTRGLLKALLGDEGFIARTGQINISRQAIERDNKKFPTKGFFVRTPGNKLKFTLDDSEYDDYNDFIFTNNLIRVNTRIDEETRTNFKRRSTTKSKQKDNRVLKVDLSTNIRSGMIDNDFSVLYHTDETHVPSWNAVHDVINKSDDDSTDSSRKEVSVDDLFSAVGLGDTIAAVRKAEDEAGITSDESLVPETVLFDSRLNALVNGKERGPVAVTATDASHNTYAAFIKQDDKVIGTSKTLPIGATLVGNMWINHLSHKVLGTAQTSVRTLMHERLHQHLHRPEIDRVKFINELRDIYKKFISEYKKDENKDKRKNYIDRWITQYEDFIDYTEGSSDEEMVLEEFAVECLSSPLFFNYMNSIYDNATNNKGKTLFDKLLDFLQKLFNWSVQDKSLNARYVNLLRDISSPVEKVDNGQTLTEPTTEESISEGETETSPENETENESETEEETDDASFNLDDLFDDIDEDEDVKHSASESFAIDETPIRNPNIYEMEERLPMQHRKFFRTLRDNGWIDIKCN